MKKLIFLCLCLLTATIGFPQTKTCAPKNYITKEVKELYSIIDDVRENPAFFAQRWSLREIATAPSIGKIDLSYPGVVSATQILVNYENTNQTTVEGFEYIGWGIGQSIEEVVHDMLKSEHMRSYLLSPNYSYYGLSVKEVKGHPGWYRAVLFIPSESSFYTRN